MTNSIFLLGALPARIGSICNVCPFSHDICLEPPFSNGIQSFHPSQFPQTNLQTPSPLNAIILLCVFTAGRVYGLSSYCMTFPCFVLSLRHKRGIRYIQFVSDSVRSSLTAVYSPYKSAPLVFLELPTMPLSL